MTVASGTPSTSPVYPASPKDKSSATTNDKHTHTHTHGRVQPPHPNRKDSDDPPPTLRAPGRPPRRRGAPEGRWADDPSAHPAHPRRRCGRPGATHTGLLLAGNPTNRSSYHANSSSTPTPRQTFGAGGRRPCHGHAAVCHAKHTRPRRGRGWGGTRAHPGTTPIPAETTPTPAHRPFERAAVPPAHEQRVPERSWANECSAHPANGPRRRCGRPLLIGNLTSPPVPPQDCTGQDPPPPEVGRANPATARDTSPIKGNRWHGGFPCLVGRDRARPWRSQRGGAGAATS